jgi:hypothetical protein
MKCFNQNLNQTVMPVLLLFFSFFLSYHAHAQGYAIEMKYFDAAATDVKMNLTWSITPRECKLQTRSQLQGKSVTSSFYIDTEKNTIKMMDENPENGKKIFYTAPVSGIKPDPRFDYKRGKAMVVNETRKIAGFLCKKIVFTTEKFSAELWVAENLPDVKPWARFFQSYPELHALSEAGVSGFPLASELKDLSGKTMVSYEATSVVEKQFRPADFLVPDDYIDAALLQRKQ